MMLEFQEAQRVLVLPSPVSPPNTASLDTNDAVPLMLKTLFWLYTKNILVRDGVNC